jgi:hypothetical protein
MLRKKWSLQMAPKIKNMNLTYIAGWCLLLMASLAGGLIFAANQDSDMRKLQAEEELASIAERDKLEKEIEQHMAKIKAEAAGLKNHPWAGEYFEGDGLGTNIRLLVSPVAGVAATWHGCLGLYGAKSGAIQQNENGVLKFSFDEEGKKGFGDFDTEMLPVRWGERHYLIPEKRLADFSADINFGNEPRDEIYGVYPLARGDEKKPVKGLPNLPPEYLKRIRKLALLVNVREVENLEETTNEFGCDRKYRLTLDKGSSDGLHVGDSLVLTSSGNQYERIFLKDVQDTTASGEITTYTENCTDKASVPDKAWQFSTGAYVVR